MKKADLRLAFAAAFTTALAVAIVVIARAPAPVEREGPPSASVAGPEEDRGESEEPREEGPPTVAEAAEDVLPKPAESPGAARAGGEEDEASELPPGAQAFGLGPRRVLFFREERRMVLGGRVCLDAPNATLEYLACFEQGKEYESVVAVTASASHVNLAMLALGYNAGGGVAYVGDPRVPQGDPVFVEVEWRDESGETVRVRGEDLIWNGLTKRPMRRTAWVYTGSRMIRDDETGRYLYMAALDGVMAACYRDPNAIFNSPLDTGADDVYYTLNTRLCPPKGTPVEITIAPARPEDVELHDLPEKD